MVSTSCDWSSLEAAAAAGGGSAQGAAASFPQGARLEAANKLISNRARVLNDVCNPSRKSQPIPLPEAVPVSSAFDAEQCMMETARRLLGSPAAPISPSGAGAKEAWVLTARIIDARLQSQADQCPRRPADMGEEAGAALRAMLKQVSGTDFPSRVCPEEWRR